MAAPSGEAATANSPAAGNQLTKSQLQQEIVSRYTTQMQNLAESYEDQLNALVGEAYNEYMTDKKQGKPVSAEVLMARSTSPWAMPWNSSATTRFTNC